MGLCMAEWCKVADELLLVIEFVFGVIREGDGLVMVRVSPRDEDGIGWWW
jgi:hypothetical protein